MTEYEWVVIRSEDNEMFCERCGEHTPMPTKVRLDTVLAMMNGFMEVHKNCEPRKSKGR